jgi:hypothetical protein
VIVVTIAFRSGDPTSDRYGPGVSSHQQLSMYEVQLVATFTFTIGDTIEGPPGLSREQVEELVDANWWWLSSSTDVLLESSWDLESFEERRTTLSNG